MQQFLIFLGLNLLAYHLFGPTGWDQQKNMMGGRTQTDRQF